MADMAQVFNTILVIAGGVSVIAAAVSWIIKAIKAAKKPTDKQNERLTNLEARVARHDELLAKDLERLNEIEESCRVMLQSILAMMDHEISGNDIARLKETRKTLENYLARK